MPAKPFTAIYQNPVAPYACPDPWVLKYRGGYWCYCSGTWHDGRLFGILYSPDLVHWTDLGGALDPPAGEGTHYGAPATFYINGQFFLYYRAGDEAGRHIRVAIADRPQGPFQDSGRQGIGGDLPPDPFVFRDEDGTSFLELPGEITVQADSGVQTALNRLFYSFPVTGRPEPIVGASSGRPSFFWRRESESEGIDLGRSTLVRGPDNRQTWIVYQCSPPANGKSEIDPVGEIGIDRLEWVGEDLLILGPSKMPQPAPFRPTLSFFSPMGLDDGNMSLEDGLGTGWDCRVGSWSRRNGKAIQEVSRPGSLAEARLPLPAASFLLELSLRALPPGFPRSSGPRALGLLLDGPFSSLGGETPLEGNLEEIFSFEMLPRSTARTATAMATVGTGERRKEFPLRVPDAYATEAFHTVRLEVDGTYARLAVDGLPVWHGQLFSTPSRMALFTRGTAAEFSALEVTAGWEHRFDIPEPFDPAALGWVLESGRAWVEPGRLILNAVEKEGRIRKSVPVPGADYEWVVNLRIEPASPLGAYGFYPASDETGAGPRLCLQYGEGGWSLSLEGDLPMKSWPLQGNFDPIRLQQFRFWKHGERVTILCGAAVIAELPIFGPVSAVGLAVREGTLMVEATRLSVLEM